MNKDKILSFLVTAGKALGFVATIGAIPIVPPHIGLVIVAGSSTLKEIVKFVGDLTDDGKKNDSFNP